MTTTMKTHTCVECHQTFDRPSQRGRIPSRCPECKANVENAEKVVTVKVDKVVAEEGPVVYRPRIGSAEAQCPICNRIFTSDYQCELHKNYKGPRATCIDPTTLGMVTTERHGRLVWSRPTED